MIGTTAAILGAAAIGGGTALAGGAMQSKAADKSAQAATQAADKSDATQRYIFDTTRNDNALNRTIGNGASLQLARLMGLNMPTAQSGQMPANALQGSGQGNLPPWKYSGDDALSMNGYSDPVGGGTVSTMQYGAAQPVPSGGMASSDPTAWLRSTPGYDFNLKEGMRGLNLAAGNRGLLNSGGAAREAIQYGQNYGDRIYNQERNALFNLAGFGQVANSANQAAGTNYANASTSINQNQANALGSSYQNSANAWTNALGGAAGAGMWALGKF